MPTATHQHLRALAPLGGNVGVDRENRIVYGVIVAQTGEFKSGRGAFDEAALRTVVSLMKANGQTKSRWGHPTDGGGGAATLNSFIGWFQDPRLNGNTVRADLHLSDSAFIPLSGGTSTGDYLLARVETDAASLNCSLVLDAEQEFSSGNQPPLWKPTAVIGVDVVDDGDAVFGGFLNAQPPKSADETALRKWYAQRQEAERLRSRAEELELRADYALRQLSISRGK